MGYNGHPTWEHWNAALWVGNDEPLYHVARSLTRADFIAWCDEHFPRTPDGCDMTAELAGYAWDSVHDEQRTG